MLPDWLRRRAVVTPEREAIVCGDTRWSFADFNRRADAAAARLIELGMRTGDRVGLLAANSATFAQCVYAVVRAGGVLVPLNTRLTPSEIAWQVEDCGASFLISDRLDQIQTSARGIDLSELSKAPGIEFDSPEGYEPDALHSIIYTSGTTGRPKGAMLTHGNFYWSAFGSLVQLGLQPDDRWLACLPLFHVGGLSIVLRSVLNGTTGVIHESFDPARANAAIDEEGMTIVSLVSTMLQRMLELRDDRPFPSSLRCVLLGGGPLPPELVQRCVRAGIPVAQTYGLTETASQVTTLPPEQTPRRIACSGRPLLVTELRIEREDGTAAGPGEAGEIVLRGPTVSPGYFGRPEDTARVWRGGWLHSGDAGYVDDEGYLYVLDRRDDLIVSGGENVYPAEVESVLASHPAVREAGVFALENSEWGQSVAAAVCLYDDAEADEASLLAHCRDRLAGYKLPRRLFFLDELPRTASGKLQRRELRTRFEPKE